MWMVGNLDYVTVMSWQEFTLHIAEEVLEVLKLIKVDKYLIMYILGHCGKLRKKLQDFWQRYLSGITAAEVVEDWRMPNGVPLFKKGVHGKSLETTDLHHWVCL